MSRNEILKVVAFCLLATALIAAVTDGIVRLFFVAIALAILNIASIAGAVFLFIEISKIPLKPYGDSTKQRQSAYQSNRHNASHLYTASTPQTNITNTINNITVHDINNSNGNVAVGKDINQQM